MYIPITGGMVPSTITTAPSVSTTIPYPCPVDDEWEEEVVIIKKRKRKPAPYVPYNPYTPLPTPQPNPWQPWGYHEPCAIEEFFKQNPNGTCMLVCFCPRHRVTC